MSRKYMLLGLFFMTLVAQDGQLFDEANDYYKQSQFDKALQTYKKIKHKDASVWFNMGNASFHMQNYIKSVLYWLRAQKYGDMSHVALSQQKLEQIESFQDLKSVSIFNRLYLLALSIAKRLSLFWWQFLFLSLWYVLFGLICFYKKREKKALFIGVTISGLFFVALLMAALCYARKPQALVMNDEVSVFNGPNQSYYVVGTLKKGSLINVTGTAKKWYKIDHNDISGWVNRSAVAKI